MTPDDSRRTVPFEHDASATLSDADPLMTLRAELLEARSDEADDDALEVARIMAATEPLTLDQRAQIVARLLREQAADAVAPHVAPQLPAAPRMGLVAWAMAAACVLCFFAARHDPARSSVDGVVSQPVLRAPVAPDDPSAPALAMHAELARSRDEAAQLTELGEAYARRAMYEKAEALFRRALALREQVLGPVHEDVADSLNRLATLYQSQHMYAKAEPLYFRALEIQPPVVIF